MQFRDRVKQTTATTGTGAYTISALAVPGSTTFAASFSDGATVPYCCADDTDYEVGIGTYTAATNSLSRDTILSSSNSGAAVNWGAGDKDIFCTLPAVSLPVYTTSDPTISTNPPLLGAKQINVITGEEWVCTNNTPGANVWRGNGGAAYARIKASVGGSCISHNSTRQVLFDTAVTDTDGFAGSNGFVIPSGFSGQYRIYAQVSPDPGGTNILEDLTEVVMEVRVNEVLAGRLRVKNSANAGWNAAYGFVEVPFVALSAADVVTFYCGCYFIGTTATNRPIFTDGTLSYATLFRLSRVVRT